ncbi:MAG TPA: CBS domain-containing protein [Polyangiaceae bacterium]|nr:CBS domain-containing protein [Polyangiaceae bacterium]
MSTARDSKAPPMASAEEPLSGEAGGPAQSGDGNTHGHKLVTGELSGEGRRAFMRTVLRDLRGLERMLAEGMFERGVSRIGAEQEMFLVDDSFGCAPRALELLERLDDPHFTTELGLFNLELNADPQPFSGGGLAALERQLGELYGRVQQRGAEIGVEPVLAGILPTIAKSDLGLANIVPNPRYLTINRVMNAARGEAYDLSIKGLDELMLKHDSIMFEACNASFQVHLQVAEPERFAHYYNVAQLVLAPTLAVGTNSPTLFGKRLWAETRIALFEQSCDIRAPGHHLRDRAARVSFGRQWISGGVAALFKDNVARFRPLVGTDDEEDALATLDRGGVPELKALRLHNGTIYRWNRACYGISENGKPHLRIELRAIPSGPTVLDEVANAAFWLGLMRELTATVEDLPARMEFDHAQANFYAAARDGLAARLTWLDGEEAIAQPLVLDKLLPLAESGLRRAGIDDADAARYLGVVEQRVRTLRTGSRWMLRSLAGMSRGSPGERLGALVAGTIARQKSGTPVAEWDDASLGEVYGKRTGYNKVSHYMATDVLTVQPDDAVEMVAELMSWQRVRHLPVETPTGELVGLISARAVLRHMTEHARKSESEANMERDTAVSDLMRKGAELVTVTPDTATTVAIALMRRHRIGCLPVVQDGSLVGLVTEEDFMEIAAALLENQVGQVEPASEHPRRRGNG